MAIEANKNKILKGGLDMPHELTWIIIEAIQKTNNQNSETSVPVLMIALGLIFVAYNIYWCKYIKWQSEISQK